MRAALYPPSLPEKVALSGQVVAVECFNDEMTERWYVSGFRPKYFYPPLPLFLFPEKCPEDIADLLAEVSALILAPSFSGEHHENHTGDDA